MTILNCVTIQNKDVDFLKTLYLLSFRDDTGNYSCVAENSHGLGESNNVSIAVHFIPTCVNKKPDIITISVHESIDLECGMTSRPGNVSFRWQMSLSDTSDVYEERMSTKCQP